MSMVLLRRVQVQAGVVVCLSKVVFLVGTFLFLPVPGEFVLKMTWQFFLALVAQECRVSVLTEGRRRQPPRPQSVIHLLRAVRGFDFDVVVVYRVTPCRLDLPSRHPVRRRIHHARATLVATRVGCFLTSTLGICRPSRSCHLGFQVDCEKCEKLLT